MFNASSAIPRKYRILRILNTMLVCSIWHGIKPGYYISFLSVPFITMCEEICERNIRSRLQSESARRIYDVFNWITFKMYCFSFLFGGFMLLQLDAVLRLYKSIYFYGYLFPITMVVVSYLFKKIVPKEKTK
uniref:Leukocyte receptor cluster member 4 n=1 Tax=Ciona savignyi TaxID=51511 RepID=H2ZCH7_CIOSA